MIETDAQLVGELQKGSQSAFAELYQRYRQGAYTYCLRMLGDPEAASDIVQGTFLKLYQRSSQIREPERFRYWLLATVRHDCLTCLRQRNNDHNARDQLSRADVSPDLDSKSYSTAELTRLLAKAIEELPADLRETVILREYEDLTYQEIAEITGVKLGLVKFRLFTARKRLAQVLSPVLKG